MDDGEEEHEGDDRQGVEAREEDEGEHRDAVSRVPVGAHVAPDAEDVDGGGQADEDAADAKAVMMSRAR